ncbi:NAD(P)-dependent alcohol dehydrogenase [Halioxenophilus sp. WMMB6]|uniref:NAD(P)-dependent alcohol dehydrogenase n=1 Tax=Halioxenophilus sp. WMMB6 TaxID=3073815 RepID=UPI00295F553A|nr:NAD(P)-dependent alcohol dehydrogenase [Halioxenophilus sp. WMMB6]
MKIKAAVAKAPHSNFSLETLDIEKPRANEVLVKIKGVGICHTDLIARDQFIPIPLPAVLGHEGAGEVVAVGDEVTKVHPGDAVILSFLSCGHCPRCEEGLSTYCQDFPTLNYGGCRADGSTPLSKEGAPVSGSFFGQSSFATYAIASERNVVKVTDQVTKGVPLEILGPLGCGIQTGAGSVINSLRCKKGSSLIIFGAGAVGLSAVMAAKIRQCKTIIAVDPVTARRDLALELGATHVFDSADDNLADKILALCPRGADYALDTSGNPTVINNAITSLGSYGVLGLVGVPPNIESLSSFNIAHLITYGIQIKGIIIGDSQPDTFIPRLIDLYISGDFPFDRLIKTFAFEAFNAAIDSHKKGECVKAVILTN